MMGYAKTDAATTELPKSARTAAREAFFLEFSKEVRKRHPGLVLMLTGGFRTRAGAESAILDGACDLVGIGRPAAIDPKFPLLLLDESVAEGDAGMPLNKAPVPWYTRFLPLHLVGAGAESVSLLFRFLVDLISDFGLGLFADFHFTRLIMLARFSAWLRVLLLSCRPCRLLYTYFWLFCFCYE